VVAASVAGACGKGDAPKGAPKEGAVALPPAAATAAEMPKRPLGKTGVMVSMIGIGGSHVGDPSDEADAVRIVRTAVDRGVTFLDNCWDYHKGESEVRMGKALRDGYRDKAFLMTKLDGRTKQAAAAQLEQSLRRLQTDRIDLVQVHEVIRATDPDRVFGPGGAIEALVEAKRAGKLRFIGFTGHKHPDIHLKMLAAADAHGFAFDAVQMPLNVMDAHYESFEKKVLPVLLEKKIGVLGMKSMGGGIILKSKAVTPVECLRYAMNLPTSVVITGCDSVGVLEQAIATALAFEPLGPAEVAAVLDKTREAAKNGEYEKFKTSEHFDGTAKNPKWLEGAEV
jgi:aryl-alcohol dehydrogenase-like predicted oxidoreductase